MSPRKQSWGEYKSWLSRQTLPTPVRACVDELLGLRDAAEASRARTERALREVSRLPQYAPLVQALSDQEGVGWFTSIRFILELGDIQRFPNADSLPNFLGLAPSEYSTGETVRRGHIRRCGPKQIPQPASKSSSACAHRSRCSSSRTQRLRVLQRSIHPQRRTEIW